MNLRRSAPLLALLAIAPLSKGQDKDKKVTFKDHVLPIMENRCLNCHNPDESKGGLDLSTYAATMNGGSGGKVAFAEDPEGSRLYRLMAHLETPHMPPEKPKSPDAELNTIKDWILGGMLETSSSRAQKNDKPKLDMSVPVALGKPDGPPPMPQDLILQPDVIAERAYAVPSVAHSPWAPICAVAGQKQVLLYHSQDLELLGVLPFPEGFPQTLSFSRNGSLIMCGGGRGGKNGLVVAWDVKSGERVIEVGKEFESVLGADISPDQKQVILGGPDRNIKVWDTVTGEQTNTIKKHPDWMLTAEYSPDGVLFATGGRNADLYVWEAATGMEFYTMKGFQKAVTDVSWRPDSNVVAACSEDGQVIMFEMTEGKEVKKWAAHPAGALCIDYAPDGTMATGGRDNSIKIWKGDGTAVRTIQAQDFIMSLAYSDDGKRIVSSDLQGRVQVWNVETGAPIGELNANPPTIDGQIAYSTQRIQELTTNLPKMEEAIKAAGAEVAKSRENLENGKKASAEAAKKRDENKALLGSLDGQIKQAAAQAQQAEGQLPQKQADAKNKADALAKATEASKTAKANADKWTQELPKLDLAVKQATAAEAAAKAEAAKPSLDEPTQKALAAAAGAETNATNARNKAQGERDAAAKAQQEAQGKLDALKGVPETPAPQLKQAEDALAAAKTAVQQKDQALAQATTALQQASAAAKPLREKETAGKAVVEKAKTAHTQQQQALAAAQKNLTEAKGQSEAAAKALAAADGALKTAQAADAAAKAEVQKIQTTIAEKKKAANDMRTQLTAAQNADKGLIAAAENAAKQIENLENAVKASGEKESAAKTAFETAKAELGNTHYLAKKWAAAAVNLEAHEAGKMIGDMEVRLESVTEEFTAAKAEYDKAAGELAAAEKTLGDAQKAVDEGRKALAEQSTSVLQKALELAAAKAVNGTKGSASQPEVANEADALKAKLGQLESYIKTAYTEADRTQKVIADASVVAQKTPQVVAERAKVHGDKDATYKEAVRKRDEQATAVEAQKKKVEELKKRYLEMQPKKEAPST